MRAHKTVLNRGGRHSVPRRSGAVRQAQRMCLWQARQAPFRPHGGLGSETLTSTCTWVLLRISWIAAARPDPLGGVPRVRSRLRQIWARWHTVWLWRVTGEPGWTRYRWKSCPKRRSGRAARTAKSNPRPTAALQPKPAGLISSVGSIRRAAAAASHIRVAARRDVCVRRLTC